MCRVGERFRKENEWQFVSSFVRNNPPQCYANEWCEDKHRGEGPILIKLSNFFKKYVSNKTHWVKQDKRVCKMKRTVNYYIICFLYYIKV